jgi:peptide/nickel transport system substrate-binding protein
MLDPRSLISDVRSQISLIALLIFFAFPIHSAAQTFVFGAQGEPVCLDPPVVTDGISQRVISQIYEGLVKYKGATTEIAPSLAERWEVSRDGRAWTFHLRKNLKFHDGTPLTASVVAWNFERWRSSSHPQHADHVRAGRTFEYYEAQFGGLDDKSLITHVEAVNPLTVRIRLKEPQGPFLSNLAMASFVLSSPTAFARWGAESCRHPVGTGPFKFARWTADQEVTLEAHMDYWDSAARPKVSRVVIRTIKDNSQRLAALKAGEIHAMEGLNPDDVKVVKGDSKLQLLLRPANTTGYLAFNYKVREFQSPKVRLAFALAINRRAIVDSLYGGTGLVATQFQPPVLWGVNLSIKPFDRSPDRAKALLAEAGFPQGIREINWEDGRRQPLELWYLPVSRPYFPNPKEIAEAIAADLAKVGITARLVTVDWTVYLDKRKNGQLPLYMLGWTGDNGDPDNFLCYFFCAPGASREGFYSNPRLAEILLNAQRLIDQKQRAPLYRRAEQMIHDDVARLFIAHNQPPLALLKSVQGYVPHPTATEYFNTIRFAGRPT